MVDVKSIVPRRSMLGRTILELRTAEDGQGQGLATIHLASGGWVRLVSESNHGWQLHVRSLLGFDKVRVAPTGLTLLGFVQSANWNQYLVSALSFVASTLSVKSTS